LNFRLCMTHLWLDKTPNLGVHQTGSSSDRPSYIRGYSLLQIALFAFALLRLSLIATVEIHDQVAKQRLSTTERGVVGFWVGSRRRS
ncbi:hypothetical protein, partial [Bradyrhizobium sp. 23]|uniref:hypothetical protein n=1 Tax=Bradyrhizobium sp. 23 TaxID=2782667 RepID=UPI001FF9B912